MTSSARPAPVLERADGYFVGRFQAMASPCEVLVDTDDPAAAGRALRVASEEAWRIERKFSRYLSGNLVDRIHRSGGAPVKVDRETAHLLDYAATCHALSDGRFDLTSGVLRRVWRFDGSDRVPAREAVDEVLALVGWERVGWDGATLTLPAGMELDFGGIGKEYAVDRAAGLVAERATAPFLVNFGGDLSASGPRRGDAPWSVGIDDPGHTGEAIVGRLDLRHGGLATSGDARRFVTHEGRRLGHILDPRTGWPVAGAPRAVTVLAATCLEAGTLATLAILHGAGAAEFLAAQGVEHRVW